MVYAARRLSSKHPTQSDQDDRLSSSPFTYTIGEMTIKRKFVNEVADAARANLRERKIRGWNGRLCVNAISKKAPSESLTLKEFNELVDVVMNDTIFGY